MPTKCRDICYNIVKLLLNSRHLWAYMPTTQREDLSRRIHPKIHNIISVFCYRYFLYYFINIL